MQSLRTRAMTLIVICLLHATVAGQPQDATRPQALAWIAVRSFTGLEQRFREFIGLTQVPGLADMLLGLIQFQFAGFQGLDRQRPIGLALTALASLERPEYILAVPYTDQEAMQGTLRLFLPAPIMHADLMYFQSQPLPLFGRFDADAAWLLLSPSPEALRGPGPARPDGMFDRADGRPDLAVRLDTAALRQRYPAAWQTLVATVEQDRYAAWQRLERRTDSPADRAFLTAYFGFLERHTRLLLTHVTMTELRVTLAANGWHAEIETRFQAGSPPAMLFNRHLGHLSPGTGLFSPEATARFLSSLLPNAEMQRDVTTLLTAGSQAAETHLMADDRFTPEQRDQGKQGLAHLTAFLSRWLTHEPFELAVESHGREATKTAITGWLPVAESQEQLDALLEAISKLAVVPSPALRLTREVMQIDGIAVHRVDVSHSFGAIDTVFLAAHEPFIIFHAGASPTPLVLLLSRLRQQGVPVPTRTDLLLQWACVPLASPESVVRCGASPSASEHAIIAQILRETGETREPLRIEVQAQPDTVVQRHVMPSPYVRGLARTLGQRLIDSVRQVLMGR